jgi:hypothetical protein
MISHSELGVEIFLAHAAVKRSPVSWCIAMTPQIFLTTEEFIVVGAHDIGGRFNTHMGLTTPCLFLMLGGLAMQVESVRAAERLFAVVARVSYTGGWIGGTSVSF